MCSFFFFKQKTAYEMRISDWSSDVCSSDLINRDIKRAKLAEKFASKRAALKAIIDDQSKSDEERYQARLQLQQLPRNSSTTRQRNRRVVIGRSRGVYSKFGLTRHKLRETATHGEVPGLRSEERRGGKECVSTCRPRDTPDKENKKKK